MPDLMTHGEGLRFPNTLSLPRQRVLLERALIKMFLVQVSVCPKSRNQHVDDSGDAEMEQIAGSSWGQAHANITRLRRVGQDPDRDEIHASLSISANILQRDTARDLQWNLASCKQA